MIIDDEPDIRNGLARYFPWKNIGFEVIEVKDNAKSAFEYLQKNPMDVVLTDIEMPNMTGIELSKKIHDAELPIKVVLLSAYKKFEYAQSAIDYHVFAYITKPTVYAEIQEVFENLRRELDMKNSNPEDTNTGYYENLVIEAKQIMGKDLKNATLISVSETMGRSQSFISRIFTKIEGASFTDSLMKMRMKMANKLLISGKHKIYEVSEMVGYTNPKNFTRAYKKHFGNTPREYRTTPQEKP